MKIQDSQMTNAKFDQANCKPDSLSVTGPMPICYRSNTDHGDTQSSEFLPQDEGQAIPNVPSKVYENCQRTARVVLLSELQKHIGKNKKVKQYLAKKLELFLPEKTQNYEPRRQYSTKKQYFKSLHYSRTKIGHWYFINNVLLDEAFREKFEVIFEQKTYDGCEKARKNQNSQVSFEKRKKVIMTVIGDYKKKFYEHFSGDTKVQKAQEAPQPETTEQEKAQTSSTSQERLRMEEPPNQAMCVLLLPIIPIPLSPLQYQFYRKSQNGCSQRFLFN